MKNTDFMGDFDPEGLISFEEITDYSLVSGKILKKKSKKRKMEDTDDAGAKKKKQKLKKHKQDSDDEEFNINDMPSDSDSEPAEKKPPKKPKKTKNKKNKSAAKAENSTSRLTMHDDKAKESELSEEDLYKEMSAWSDILLPKSLLRGLHDQGFFQPTPIQRLVVPDAVRERKNVIGAAQTGSGKTLAFGLPILTRLIDSYEQLTCGKDGFKEPQALILTPTRELAIQIKEHLQRVSKYQKTKIVAIVGGISEQKQKRLLNKLPEIIVATPGRLLQMIEEGNEYLGKLSEIRYLVIDEADRMIEKGHYSEMEKILDLVNSNEKTKPKRQNFLFSATLTTNLKSKAVKAKDKKSIDVLIEKIHMTKEPKIVDLTTASLKADLLSESKIFCAANEKDIYLYYFVTKYTGRTLVFANSIDCVRRLTNVFRLLQRDPLHLHANMNQKMRLKNLEKFNLEPNGVLIASDVAARGLDIPGVMHVIHYQTPRSVEIYIHRSGRTARSMNQGYSVLFSAPDEMNLYRKIMTGLNKGKISFNP